MFPLAAERKEPKQNYFQLDSKVLQPIQLDELSA